MARPPINTARPPILTGGLPMRTARLPIGIVVGEASKLCDKSTDAKLGSFTHYVAKLKTARLRYSTWVRPWVWVKNE